MNSPGNVIEFSDFALDIGSERLSRGDEILPLRPKAFALLKYLVLHPGVLLTKERLLESVWENRVISEGGLSELIRELRKVLGDDFRTPRFIETVHRRGYRFIGLSSPEVVQPAASATSPARPAKDEQLVGRDAELERLRRHYSQADAGNRQIVFVTGEPGIGKTTLLTAFTKALGSTLGSVASVRVAWGQCIEQYGASEPYLPVLHALSQLVGNDGHDEVIELLRIHAPAWVAAIPRIAG